MLCKDCECKFSKWENILKHDLIDFEKKSSSYLDIQEIKNEAIKVKNIRYKEFKLAVLSLLWRMSISSSNFYEDYNLGPYDETLRDILFNEKFVKESRFPIFVSRYELDGKFDPGLFMGFPPGRSGHFIVQKFIIWGHCFSIFVNNKMKQNILSTEEFLRETGELYIDIRSLTELASPKSVISKIFDKNVQAFYDKKKKNPKQSC